MRCDQCQLVLVCWTDSISPESLIRCHKCDATMQQIGDYWYFWHCTSDQRPTPHTTHICVECSPITWTRSTRSLNHIISREAVGNRAQKQWRAGLYRTLSRQIYERDSLEAQKKRIREQECEDAMHFVKSLRKNPGHVPRCHYKKKSDVGKMWKR